MNIKIDIDVTPEEMRRLMGWPDLEAFQRQLLDDIRARMMQGAEGYDPLALFQPYLKGSLAGMDMWQRMLAASMGRDVAKTDAGQG